MENEQSDLSQEEGNDENFELEPLARATQTMGFLADTVNAEILDNSVNQQRSYFIFRRKLEPVKSFWTVNVPIRDFRGRHELLKIIHKKLQHCSTSVHWQDRTLVLVGFGGMGKSELSRKFATDYRAQYPSTAWIQADTEESLKSSFFKLAKLLGLRVKRETSAKEIAKVVFRHVGKHIPSTLFIYDNANSLNSTDDAHGILEYLPNEVCEYPPLILITSQTTKDWKRDRIEIISVTELTRSESAEFFRLRFGLSEEQLRHEQRLKAEIHELSECLQGYPLGLQLAAANIKYVADDDPKSSLHQNLKNFISMLKGGIGNNKVLDQTPDATMDYPRTFNVIWSVTLKRLSSEMCVSPALHVMRILAYCNPDRTDVNDLQHIYNVSVPNEVKLFGDETLDLVIKKLEQLSLVSRYTEGWTILRDSCVRMHRIVQKLVRRDDTEGFGLKSILLSDKPFMALNYMTCEPVLAIPPSVLRDEQLCGRWLLCFGYALRQGHNFPFNNAVRLQLNSASEEQLQSGGNGTGEATLAAVEFIRKVETEKDVEALYLASVEYATKHPASALHHVAELCAFKCWTAKPLSCNPLIYPLFIFIGAVRVSIAFSWLFLLGACCIDVSNNRLEAGAAAFIAVSVTLILFWLFRFPRSYFWFRMVVGMKNYKSHIIGILYVALGSVGCMFASLLGLLFLLVVLIYSLENSIAFRALSLALAAGLFCYKMYHKYNVGQLLSQYAHKLTNY